MLLFDYTGDKSYNVTLTVLLCDYTQSYSVTYDKVTLEYSDDVIQCDTSVTVLVTSLAANYL